MNRIESVIMQIAVAGMVLWAVYFVSNDMIAGACICGGLAFLGLAYLEVCEQKTQKPQQSKRTSNNNNTEL